ncbi:cob(I)yrinic acid a,c-diamide adenosyltransferase [Anaerobranca californiensis DSM 14826]|uniref:Cob(I)yrinic acid a,c-diamide adenosyltransferase n=1 Tax=Anaerobranca californiensis DSM 14826 TaxID=1120989 RepID=A0A1M6N6D3_9FIRM|nr:cob(I)yrinic acid a,c-diamide adenosyltransferase [Anaerobranca californiensis]SHJ91259.1 cob(I)yrinic acid a,c-diamide adenosyltransferase [Anaerobranca californiensis DSM 14826]
METGLIQVYTGNSKGKTTAALGLAMRAIGHGLRVNFIQLMKGSNYYGELVTIHRLFPDIVHAQFGRPCPNSGSIKLGISKCTGCGRCFIKKGDDITEDKKEMEIAYEYIKKQIKGGQFHIIILDEILNCIYFDLITEEEVLELFRIKPPHVELVLTGRNAPEKIIEEADLVTNMESVKHPFERGINARRGIEY